MSIYAFAWVRTFLQFLSCLMSFPLFQLLNPEPSQCDLESGSWPSVSSCTTFLCFTCYQVACQSVGKQWWIFADNPEQYVFDYHLQAPQKPAILVYFCVLKKSHLTFSFTGFTHYSLFPWWQDHKIHHIITLSATGFSFNVFETLFNWVYPIKHIAGRLDRTTTGQMSTTRPATEQHKMIVLWQILLIIHSKFC